MVIYMYLINVQEVFYLMLFLTKISNPEKQLKILTLLVFLTGFRE